MQDKIRPGYKQTEVGVIPEDWDCLQLGEIAGTITTGKLDANAMSKEGDYPFFTCAREIYRIDKFAFDADALLVSGNGANVGYVHHYIGKFNAYQRTYVLKDFSAETVYLRLQLERGIQARIRTEVNAGNTPYILMGTLSGMNIPLPPTAEEQRAIAEALGDADALIAALEAMIAKKRDLKQAAMQQILTGKTRLPGFGPTIAKYKKSEVGAIPEDWNLAKLGEVCSFENGDRGVNYPSGNDFVANGVPFVNAGHLGAQGNRMNNNDVDKCCRG
jgi:type I restriction enzyme S subunit